ncbi:hypothetical protein AV530_007842 [Patagioenas fasciata monilis]|uniref:Uncharacterized protein n=1 Tax=Patagioenas fasciata monilis TaxID=372326 RepID=A0A1V4JT56_PATFA|nr:hypothetical protein AV530_007842 [Patagioenas fasciata monilis]
MCDLPNKVCFKQLICMKGQKRRTSGDFSGNIIQSQAYNPFQRSMGKYIHETNPKVNRLIHHSKTQVGGFWTRGMKATFEQSKPAKFDDADLICLLA